MKKTLVIFAHNEEENIGNLLESLLLEQIEEIIVVSSSTDRTNAIVERYSKTEPRIKLIKEMARSGVAHAMTLGIENASGDAIVVLCGDNLPEKGSLAKLFAQFNKPKVGAVFGRPVPINDPGTFLGFIVHIIWNLHHLISLTKPKLSGEYFGFRSGLIKKIPFHINCNDDYSQMLVEQKRYEVIYVQDAITYMKGPTTIRDLIHQRTRVLAGHRQISRLYGYKVPTLNRATTLLLLPKSVPEVNHWQKAIWVFFSICLESSATILALWKDMKKSYLPVWQPISSTKTKIVVKSQLKRREF